MWSVAYSQSSDLVLKMFFLLMVTSASVANSWAMVVQACEARCLQAPLSCDSFWLSLGSKETFMSFMTWENVMLKATMLNPTGGLPLEPNKQNIAQAWA